MEMTELLPTHVDPPVKFSPVTLENLDNANHLSSFTLGQFSKGDNFVWVTRSSCLEVLNCRTAGRCGAWNFGAITKEVGTTITCVVELRTKMEPLLLVGLHSRGIGMLCVFNPVKSKLVSAVELPSKVVSLEVVDYSNHTEVIISYLQIFSGLVAVGMEGGLVYLLDLCLDQWTCSDETQPATVNALPASTPQIHSIRDSLEPSEHLAIILDDESCVRGSYLYRRPDGKTMQSFDGSEVCITAMRYIAHIGALVIGLNFGCFQIWKMDCLMLEYSSPYEADLAPITQFTYQEPENDPKNFVYLWIGRGPTFVDRREGDCSALSLYQLSYDNKKILKDHGVLYTGLQSVMHKFEHPLTADPYNVNGVNVYGSTLISCGVVKDAAHQRVARREDGIEDHEDLSLCAFLWDASTEPESKPVYLLGLFDLNRWYHAQMPHSLRPSYLCHGVCPFFAFCNLEDIVEIAGPECLLAAQLSTESVTRYRSTAIPPPEQHYYPSALAFDLHCLLENSLVSIHFSGVQKQILYDLRKNNPGALIEPTDTYNRCSLAEILPKFCEAQGDVTVSDQRDALLGVCVENAMTDVVLVCVNTWADGEYSRSGCTLRAILTSAWGRVVKAKEAIDKTSVPLFDCSVTGVDKQTVSLLHQQESELGRLCRVFQQLLNLAATTTEQGAHDLRVKLSVTSLLHEYMQVLTWLVVVGVLPETMEGDLSTGKYNYPSDSLPGAYTQRRQQLLSLHQDLSFTDLLVIDGLVDHLGGQVKDLWNKEGGNGLYPPPSLHAVLALYLLEDVRIQDKHCVMFYLLLDLISFASDQDQQLVQECSLFGQCFGLSPSLARLVQGFWLLDHRDYTEAVHVLLDPVVKKEDLSPWQHTRIVKALLYQGEARAALLYMNTRLPNPTSPDDVKLKLTVLLASGNINQAFEYQRRKRDTSNCLDLVEHFFSGCLQTKNLGHLVQLPLDEFEDKQLTEFLRNNGSECMELLVMYYLQRCRYVEAIRLNEEISKLRVVETNPKMVQRAIARESIIQAHIRNLPEVQRDLVRASKPDDLPTRQERIEVCRPKPLSTKVNNNPANKVSSRAMLICAVMEKVREVELTEPEATSDESPEVFVSLPATPKPKHHINESIHTSAMEKDLTQFLKRTPPAKSPIPKISDSAKRRMQKYQNAEAMALLATPPIKRVTKSRIKPPATPQSILKVRNTVRNNSPLVVKTRSVSDSDRERPVRRNPFVSMSGSPHALTPGTPKLLRFVLSPSRSQTQLSRPVEMEGEISPELETSPELESRPAERTSDESSRQQADSHDDTVMSQIVDEEITFNFNISRLKADMDNMDTDNVSECPSTPRELNAEGEQGTPSPVKEGTGPVFPSSKTPQQLRFAAQTPREQITQFVEKMEAEEKVEVKLEPEVDVKAEVVEAEVKPESPYLPAKKLLEAFRAEYAAEHPDDAPLAEMPPSPQSSVAEDDEDDREITGSESENPEEQVTEEEMTEQTESESEKPIVLTSDSEPEMVHESKDKICETPKEVARLIRDSPEPSPFRFEPPGRESAAPPAVPRIAPKIKPDLAKIVEDAKKATAKRQASAKKHQKRMSPPKLSPEPKPEPIEVIEIESSQSDIEPEAPVLERIVDSKLSPKRSSMKKSEKSSPRRSPRIARRAVSSEGVSPDKPRRSLLREDSPPPEKPSTSGRKSLLKTSSPDSRKTIQMEDLEDTRSEHQSSPLGSEAFMMKLRHSARGSRELTPEACTDEPIQFTFSDPVSLDAHINTPTSHAPKPFIFSPPVTRSRNKRRDPDSVRSLRSSVLDPGPATSPAHSFLGHSGLLDVSVSDTGLADNSSVFETSQSHSSKKTRRKLVAEPSDSPINFISPVTGTQSEGDVPGKSKIPAPKMNLRSRFKVVRPERKSVRLMKK